MSKNLTETTNPHILEALGLKSKEGISNSRDNKNQDDLGQWRKAELKRSSEVMYHEVARPSATFSTKIPEAAELGRICYLGSLLLLPHLDSKTSLGQRPSPAELTGTSGDE